MKIYEVALNKKSDRSVSSFMQQQHRHVFIKASPRPYRCPRSSRFDPTDMKKPGFGRVAELLYSKLN